MTRPIQAGGIPEILHPALRQYRHSSGGDELIHGFDLKLTCALVEQLQAPITNDTVVIYRYQHEGAPGQWFYESTGKYYNAEPVTLGQLLALIPPGGNLPSDTMALSELIVGAEVTLYDLPYTVDKIRDGEFVMSTIVGNTVLLTPEVAQGLINDGDLTRRQS